MDTILIDIDATAFKTSLSHFAANLIYKIKKGLNIPVVEIFKTDALIPVNNSAESQLNLRSDFKLIDNLWVSTKDNLPLKLQYNVFQSGKKIRLDLTAKGDLVVQTNVDIENYKLIAAVKSNVTVVIRDSISVENQEIRISDLLELKVIEITEQSFRYKFSKKNSEEIYLTINSIYSTSGLDFLQNKPYKITFTSTSFLKEKLVKTFISSIDNQGCKPPQPAGPHTLFGRSSNGETGMGTCYTLSGCQQINERAPFDIQLGCYSSYEDASRAMDTHPMCNIIDEGQNNPFEIAQSLIKKDSER
jgi:hypothetical protein